MLTIRHRWKGKCPKHPRYDPVRGGEGAIKGSCPTCTLLFRVHEAQRMTAEIARHFDELVSAGETIAMVRNVAGIMADQDRRIRESDGQRVGRRLRSAS